MSMQAAAAFCIIGCILCVVLRQYQPHQAVLLGLAVCTCVLVTAVPELQRIVDAAGSLYARSGLAPEFFTTLCKAAGIAYLTQLGVDVCRDSGQNAIGTAVELCGRVCLVILSLPLFLTLADTVLGVIG